MEGNVLKAGEHAPSPTAPGLVFKDNPLPLYYQLKQAIKARVEAGSLPPGALIDSERELTKLYGVSRITVRQAIGELVAEGVLTRRHGKGTFVAPRRIAQPLARLQGFAEELQERGLNPQVKLLQVGAEAAPPPVLAALRLPAGAQIVVVRRLILVDGEPLCIDAHWLPEAVGRMILGADLAGLTIYSQLEALGLRIRAGEQTVEAAIASRDEAQLLGIRRLRVPVLRVERVTFVEGEQPVERSVAVYRGDRYRFRLRLQRHLTGPLADRLAQP